MRKAEGSPVRWAKTPVTTRSVAGQTLERLTHTALGSLAVVALVVATSLADSSRLGAPAYWPWLLTGAQVTALWAAGAGRWWGWPLGAAMQPPWIAYALLTGQVGFIPGCLVSAAVQTLSFVRNQPRVVTPPTLHRLQTQSEGGRDDHVG